MHSSARGTASLFPLTRLTAILLFAFGSSSAFAGGTAFDATSISAMGNASAGQAAEAGDASVLFANPAALTRFKRAELTQGAAIISIGTDYTSTKDNDGSDSGAPQGQNGQVFSRRDGSDAGALAPNLFIAMPINEPTPLDDNGILTCASHSFQVSILNPVSSSPITIAMGPVKSASNNINQPIAWRCIMVLATPG